MRKFLRWVGAKLNRQVDEWLWVVVAILILVGAETLGYGEIARDAIASAVDRFGE